MGAKRIVTAGGIVFLLLSLGGCLGEKAMNAATRAPVITHQVLVVNSLETVSIGGRDWMKRNLNIADDGSCCYMNSLDSCGKYGRLYTWAAAKRACAELGEGWRLPDTADWNALVSEGGGWDFAGPKLKSKNLWEPYPGLSANTDEMGFSAVPGGRRFNDGSFYLAGFSGNWWSATELTGSFAFYRFMSYDSEHVLVNYEDMNSVFSVRCVAGRGPARDSGE